VRESLNPPGSPHVIIFITTAQIILDNIANDVCIVLVHMERPGHPRERERDPFYDQYFEHSTLPCQGTGIIKSQKQKFMARSRCAALKSQLSMRDV
jgi:hypothetical protein